MTRAGERKGRVKSEKSNIGEDIILPPKNVTHPKPSVKNVTTNGGGSYMV